jgi:hypothetical protein
MDAVETMLDQDTIQAALGDGLKVTTDFMYIVH